MADETKPFLPGTSYKTNVFEFREHAEVQLVYLADNNGMVPNNSDADQKDFDFHGPSFSQEEWAEYVEDCLWALKQAKTLVGSAFNAECPYEN